MEVGIPAGAAEPRVERWQDELSGQERNPRPEEVAVEDEVGEVGKEPAAELTLILAPRAGPLRERDRDREQRQTEDVGGDFPVRLGWQG